MDLEIIGDYMNNRVAFIIPYFGKFNNYFPLFLKSCEANADLCDWLIYTDDKTEYKLSLIHI